MRRRQSSSALPAGGIQHRVVAGSAQRDLVVHLALPAALGLTLILGYFAGPPLLREIISPSANRELGLLESLQALLLIAALVIGLRATARLPRRADRALLVLVSLAVSFLLLEELDYGKHHLVALAGHPQSVGPFNIHNRGGTTEWIKALGDLAIVGWLGIAPLRPAIVPTRLRPFVAGRWFPVTVAVMLAVSALAHGAEQVLPERHSLSGNVSEFRELLIYYLGVVYLRWLVRATSYSPTVAVADAWCLTGASPNGRSLVDGG